MPDIPGLAAWKNLYPTRVQHSKGYRTPDDFAGGNVLLIGGSVSSTDIARELGPVCDTIYQSQRNGAFDLSAALLPDNAIRVDEVVSFAVPDAATPTTLSPDSPIPLTATLKSGGRLCDIHHVILCTGYHLTLPFLPQHHSDATPAHAASDTVLVTDGTMFHNLHQDIFYIPDATLAFVGVPFFTATFTLFEFQAMAVAKVFAQRARLPAERAMRAEYAARVRARGLGKAFHSLRDREEEYVEGLLGWVNRELVGRGEGALSGHSGEWRAAREEQVQRIRALFAAARGPERVVERVCQSVGVLEGQAGAVQAAA